jgi:hypothetical protein
MKSRHRIDRWFWRVLGVRGTAMFNVGWLLIVVALIAAAVARRLP